MGGSNQDEKPTRFSHLPLSVSGPIDCALTVSLQLHSLAITQSLTRKIQGSSLLQTPYLNKGSAFTSEERATFKLYGLLPPNVQTLEEQIARAYQQYSSRPNALAKNTFMTSVKEQNAVLFYKVIMMRKTQSVG